jgi:TonB-linked SusC/RagA family outer membrane protein
MQYDQLNKTNSPCLIAPKATFRKVLGFTFGKEPKKRFLQLALIFPALILSQTGYSEANTYSNMDREAFNISMDNAMGNLKTTSLGQEKVKVTGTVSDAQGLPLAGVSVRVKGTNSATSTDLNGKYEIELNKGQTLTFDNLGFASQEIVVNAAGTQNVTLDSSSEDISEVVVVGYGSQQKKDVTGSIAAVSMKNVKGQAVASADQALSGQIAGVQVSTSNGTPGGGPKIQIRGMSAIGAGSQPLYVIDGFPVPTSSSERGNPLATLNPNDIESMTVLKDASATAIYGSRGSNGVILINTKRGADGPMKIDVAVSSGLQQVPQKGRPNLMNAAEFAQFRKEAIEDKIRFEEGREPTIDDIPEDYRNPAALGEGVDWYDEVTRVAPLTDVNVSFSGGNENVRSFVSAGYLNQEGVMLNTGFDRFSIRANVEGNLAKKLKLGMNISPTLTYLEGGINGQGRDEFFEITTPVAKVYDDAGNLIPYIQSSGTFGNPNPVLYMNERTDKSSKLKLLMSTFAEYSFLDNLKFKTTFNVDYQDESGEYFRPSTIPNQNAPGLSIPSGSYWRGQYLNWANENTLN